MFVATGTAGKDPLLCSGRTVRCWSKELTRAFQRHRGLHPRELASLEKQGLLEAGPMGARWRPGYNTH